MKNKLKKGLTILFFIFLFSITESKVFADEIKNFDLVSVSDEKYKITMLDIVNGFSEPKDLNAYTGRKISEYSIAGLAQEGDYPLTGWLEWAYPNYVIKEGEQYVTVRWNHYGTTSFTAKLYINGVESGRKRGAEPLETNSDTSPYLSTRYLDIAKTATYTIDVLQPVEGATYKWTSDNSEAVTVGKNGKVAAVGEGDAMIYCDIVYPDGKKLSLSTLVTVIEPDSDTPKFNKSSISLKNKGEFDINVSNQIKGSKYQYTSSNKAIATVNPTNGIVTAKKAGKAVIQCTITTPDKKVIVLKSNVTVK